MKGDNDDYLPPDWPTWLKRETLTVLEAAALWCGIEPKAVRIEGHRAWVRSAGGGILLSRPLPEEFSTRYEIIRGACDVSLPIVNASRNEHPRFETVVFVKWARTRHADQPLPAPMRELAMEANDADMAPNGEPADPKSSITNTNRRPQRQRPGPKPGTVSRFDKSDEALYPVFEELIKGPPKMSKTAAANKLAEEGKIAGPATDASRAKRFMDRYRKDRAAN